MEGICITHSCIPLYTVYMQHIMAHSGGMQEWVIQIPSVPILVSIPTAAGLSVDTLHYIEIATMIYDNAF